MTRRSADLGSRTIADFGEQWTTYTSNDGYYGSRFLLADVVEPLLPIQSIKDARVADIGSGTGRIVRMLLSAGAREVIAVEPSEAFSVLVENTKQDADRIQYIKATGDRLPPNLNLDCVLSVGVLHHIPEPLPVMHAIFSALRPGGYCLIWLYGREGNEAYLVWAEPLRRLTVRLPHTVLSGFSFVLTSLLSLYIGLCRLVPRLPMRKYMLEVLDHFDWKTRRLTVYDQLNPGYAKYYTRAEAEALMCSAGFEQVRSYHRHGYSWTVLGQKPDPRMGES